MRPAVVTSKDELIALIRARQDELQLSGETIDAIAGVAERYYSKLTAHPPMRQFGEMSLKAVLGALALRTVAVLVLEDPIQAQKISPRWKPKRKTRPSRNPFRRKKPPGKPDMQQCVARSSRQGDLFANSTEQPAWQRPTNG